MKTHIKKLCDEWYNKGRADYEAECQKIFEDNPPMHFNHEQIMWLKEFVKIRCNQARAEAIEELANKAFCEWTNCADCAMWGENNEFGEEEVCILEQLKEQKNE